MTKLNGQAEILMEQKLILKKRTLMMSLETVLKTKYLKRHTKQTVREKEKLTDFLK